MNEIGLQPLLNAVYTSSKASEKLLKSLTKEAGFSAENVISRLAIARSLLEGGFSDTELLSDGGGKQIRGSTLLGRRGIATPLLAMIAASQLAPPDLEQMKILVRKHWERGLLLLERDRREAGGVDAMFMDHLENTASSEEEIDLGFDASKLRGMVVGQEDVVDSLVACMQQLMTSSTDRHAIVSLSGPQGMGKSHIAAALAHALSLSYIEVEIRPLQDGWATIRSRCQEAGMADGAGIVRSVVGINRTANNLESIRRVIEGTPEWFEGRALCLMHDDDHSELPADSTCVLEPYTREQVADILRVVFGGWPLGARQLLALAGGLNPRSAIDRAVDVKEAATARGLRVNENLCLEVMAEKWGLDRLGLSESDYAVLRALEAGEPPPLDARRDFLHQLGLILVDDVGLSLTARGSEALRATEGVS